MKKSTPSVLEDAAGHLGSARTLAKGGVWVSDWRTEFMKQVLPRLLMPPPCQAGKGGGGDKVGNEGLKDEGKDGRLRRGMEG